MRYLIKKDLMNSNVFSGITFVVLLILLVILTMFELEDFLLFILFFIILVAPLTYFMNILNYTDEDFYRLELLLPIKIYKIVLARYIEYFIVTIACVLYIGSILIFRGLFNSFYIQEAQMNVMFLGVSVSILFASFVMSGSFIFGNQNIKNISVSSFIITLLLVRLFMEYMSNKYNLANYFDIYDSRFLVSMLVAIAFSIYIISYFISLYGFRQKLR
jgi:hypothetical protein